MTQGKHSEQTEPAAVDEDARRKLWPIIALIVFILVPLVNYVVPQVLQQGDRFADDAQTRVNAAAYAFAIWGVIFTGMIWFTAFVAFAHESWSANLRKALICLSIAGLASIAFVPISIYGDQILGWIDIIAHLIPLALANLFLRRHAAIHPSDRVGRWSFFGPSMYFGWISAATVISTALMADQLGIELSETVATGAAIASVVLLGLVGIALTLKQDPVYGATVAWALTAVGVEQEAYPAIRMTAWVGAGIVAAVVLVQLSRPNRFYATATAATAGDLKRQ